MTDALTTETRPKVLVVDDDPVFLATAKACLSMGGFRVEAAADGVEALEMMSGGLHDVALIDLVMPRIDGFRLIGLMRGAPQLRNTAVMVVTTRTDEMAIHEATQLGVKAFLTKPVDWSVLADRVRALL